MNARLEGAKSIQSQRAVHARRDDRRRHDDADRVALNAYLSFDSGWALAAAERQHLAARQAKQEGTAVADVPSNEALKDWVASQSVTIALLGIRVSALDDAPVLGSAALSSCSRSGFFC